MVGPVLSSGDLLLVTVICRTLSLCIHRLGKLSSSPSHYLALAPCLLCLPCHIDRDRPVLDAGVLVNLIVEVRCSGPSLFIKNVGAALIYLSPCLRLIAISY